MRPRRGIALPALVMGMGLSIGLLTACGGTSASSTDPAASTGQVEAGDTTVTMDRTLADLDSAFRDVAAAALGPEGAGLVDSEVAAANEAALGVRANVGLDDAAGGLGAPGRSSAVVVAADGASPPGGGLGLAIGLTWATATRGNSKPLKASDVYDPTLDESRLASQAIDRGNTKGDIKTTFSPEGPTATADTEIHLTSTNSAGESIVDTAKAHLRGDICPDPSGVVTVDFTIVWDLKAKGRYGTVNLLVDASGQGTGQVDDTAKLLSSKAQGTSTLGIAETLGTSAHREALLTYETTGSSANGKNSIHPVLVKASGRLSNSTEMSSIDAVSELPYKLAQLFFTFAESKWQYGSCVQISTDGLDPPPGTTSVPAAGTKSFVGKVFHRWDSKTPSFPLEASLSGGKSLFPTGHQTAPVTYVYTAPDSTGATTTVHLESRSRRGVGTLDVGFFVGRRTYIASGGSHIEMSGTVENLDAGFSLTGTGGDGVEYTFYFSSNGSFTYEGSQQGCTENGDGSFNIDLSEDERTGTVVMQPSKVSVTCRGRTMSRANVPPVTFNLTAKD